MGKLRWLGLSFALLALTWAPPLRAQSAVPELEQEIRRRAAQIESRLIALAA